MYLSNALQVRFHSHHPLASFHFRLTATKLPMFHSFRMFDNIAFATDLEHLVTSKTETAPLATVVARDAHNAIRLEALQFDTNKGSFACRTVNGTHRTSILDEIHLTGLIEQHAIGIFLAFQLVGEVFEPWGHVLVVVAAAVDGCHSDDTKSQFECEMVDEREEVSRTFQTFYEEQGCDGYGPSAEVIAFGTPKLPVGGKMWPGSL